MVRKLLLSFLFFTISLFFKIKPKKFIFKIASLSLFLGFSLNSIYAQCNSGATAGNVSSNTDKICVGASETFWSTGWSGGSWSSSNTSIAQIVPIPGNANVNVKGIAPGTVDIIYTLTQPNCSEIKTSKKTITILGSTLGTVGEISGTASQCNGNTNQVYSIPAPTGGATYTWSVPNGNGWSIVSGQNTNSILVNIGSGNGDISVTVSNSCAGITNIVKKLSVNVNNNKTTKPTISGSTSLCIGSSITLTSSLEDSYLWSTGETTKSIIVTTAGSYTVKTTKSGSCQSDSSDAANVLTVTSPTFTTAATAIVCANASVTYTTQPSKSNYVWSLSGTAGNDYIITSGGIGLSNNSVTLQWKTEGSKTVTVNYTTGCAGYSPASSTTIVSATSAGAASSSSEACVNTAMTSITHSLANVNSISGSTGLPSGVSPTLSTDKATLTISGTPTQVGSFAYIITLSTNCGNIAATGTIKVNSTPIAPTIVSKVVPTCSVPTGSVNLSGLPTTGIVRYLAQNSTTATYTITGTTMTISGLAPGKYKFAIDNPCGPAVYSNEIDISGNTWNGTSWSGGNAGPTSNDNLVFEGDYTINNDISMCSCTVNNNAKVIVKTGKTMNVTNGVHVISGTLTFEDSSSLLQTTTRDDLNTGDINYMRSTPAPGIRQADYVYWSTPVKNQTLSGVSQDLTLSDKYYMYGGTGVSWIGVPKTTVMEIGKGYIIRGPQNWSNTSRNVYTATFKGTPNNGSFTTHENFKAGKNYLIGNPYPSALYADKLITDNPVLEGTLYFWTHNTPVVLVGAYKYEADDYATYNMTGGAIAAKTAIKDPSYNDDPPSGYIGAGQSFMAAFKDAGEITFTNAMRYGGTHNSQFFKPGKTSKTTGLEKNRVWLNITNTEGLFKQMLLGYIEGATNNYEGWYDGLSVNGNKYVDFYSINNTNKLTIQGRALPFTDADIVPLGYLSSIVGDLTIAIDHADGFFDNQPIYLEDKTTGKIHDLRAENYTFSTEKGTFNDRFVLRYTNKTLGTGDFENIENGLLVSVKEKVIKVTSAKENIKEVTIFDINGKLLYNKKKVGATELQISNLQSANQVLLVKVTLENDFTTTKTLVFQ